jgi:ketosteroid isomerase-like protein
MASIAGVALILALASGDGRDDVAAAEKKRFAAMIAGDVAILAPLLADDLTYTHSSGRVDTKAQFLDNLRSGQQKYFSIAPEDTAVRVYGDTAVSTGRSAMHVSAAGQEMRFRIQFTDVWVRRDGRWQMVAWQSTRLPEPAPSPAR